MKKLIRLYKKKKKLIIGLMSGTSLDGIDAVLVEVENSGIKTKFKELFFSVYPYPKKLKEMIMNNSLPGKGSVDEICTLNFLIGKLFAEAAINLCREYGIDMATIDLIGSHGQTIHHIPKPQKLFGKSIASTLQIGDPTVIAKETGVITVGDFRIGDMALNGQGAPLVPYFDYISFRSKRISRALLNIGGISNITLLKKNCDLSDVIAFDTGPGNMIVDFLMKKYYKKNYDKDGEVAMSGELNQKLFEKIIEKDTFLREYPPKSTGREYYNHNFINQILEAEPRIPKNDVIRTFSEYTAYAVYFNYQNFLRNECEISELIVSGGGAKNNYFMKSLKKYFGNRVNVKPVDNQLMSTDSKEAVCFAILANETIAGNPTNIPRVTGALEPTILGKICQ